MIVSIMGRQNPINRELPENQGLVQYNGIVYGASFLCYII